MRPFLLFIFVLVLLTTISSAQIFFTAKLDGAQEVPPVTTTASGTGTFILSEDGTRLTYNITVNGLTMTAAHFHNAFQGTVGAIVRDLSFTNNTASGVWSSSDATQPFNDSRLSELLRGRLYVNVHTAANPDGEIRGQVLLPGPVTFTAKLEGAQENPPVTTNAAGTGSVRLNADGTISYDITVTGLTTTAQHFHNGPVGTNGNVVKDISLTNNTGSGTWTFSDPTQPLDGIMLRELIKGRLYMNAHTSANPGGEIRGQVLLKPGLVFTANLQGSQEVPAVTTDATGTGTFVLGANGTQLVYNITVNGLTMTAAHFHNAAQGVVGNVVRDLSFTNNTSSGVWSSGEATQAFSDSMLSELLRGRLYVNVHTSANPGGEIRGQVLLTSVGGFAAKLEGAQENPPVTTNAAGTGSVRLHTDGTVSYDITVTGLTTTAQHFHNGPVGTNAGVVKDIVLTNNTGSGTWTSTDPTQPLTDFLLRELIKGRLYMNAHTSANPGGEIRGQVDYGSDVAGVTAVESIPDVVPASFTLEQNYPNPFNPATVIRYSLPVTSRLTLKVYNLLGQEVATLVNEEMKPGSYAVTWSANGMPSGMYFYRMSTTTFSQARKLLLLR